MKAPDLCPLIFLLSDGSNRELMIDVAKKLEAFDPNAVAWDFEEPIQEALTAFLDFNFGVDLADPRNLSPDELSCMEAIQDFALEHFGPEYFANKAFEEARDQMEFRDGTIIFRDATWDYIKPFLSHFKPHQVLIVDPFGKPHGLSSDLYRPFAGRHIIIGAPTVDNVVEAIKGVCVC